MRARISPHESTAIGSGFRIVVACVVLLTALGCRETLREARTHFTYADQPIHPALISMFEPYVSDLHPIITTVDVASAFKSNAFMETDIIKRDGYLEAEIEGGEIFGYQRIGTLCDEVQVVQTRSYGPGSFVTSSLFIMRFEEDPLDLPKQLVWRNRLVLKQYHYEDLTPSVESIVLNNDAIMLKGKDQKILESMRVC